jgi:hypothetical protein
MIPPVRWYVVQLLYRLALVHADITEDGKVVLTDWEETDFRTGDNPWWALRLVTNQPCCKRMHLLNRLD